MKNSLFKKSTFDNDTLLSAVKKAQGKIGAGITASQNANGMVTPSKGTTAADVPTNQLKLEQNEARLNAAERAVALKGEPTFDGETFSRLPRMSEIQQNEEYYHYETRRRQNQSREAFERNLRHDLYGEPLAEKPIPLIKGVHALDDSAGSAPLRPGGPLAKNGARTRGYTDTASDTSAPIRFTGGTLKEIERKYNEADSRQNATMKEFNQYLGDRYIDLSNLTAEQEDILDLVKKQLIKKSVLGTLTNAEKYTVFDKTLRYLYSNTRSANGDPYPVFIDIVTLDPKGEGTPKALYDPTKPFKAPEIGTMKPDSMSDDEYKAVTDYLSPKNQTMMRNEAAKLFEIALQRGLVEDGDNTKFLKNDYSEYLNQLNRAVMDSYAAARRYGAVKAGDYKRFIDWATVEFYENAVKPINIKDNKYGKGVGRTVTIGELISPEDGSFGAKIARTAFQLIGLPFEDTAKKGNRPNLEIDCQGLVRWVLAELNTDWADYAIGKGARHQINHSEKIWRADSGKDIREDIKTGDLIFWKGEETGEIVHVATFAGWYDGEPYMVEASTFGITVNPVREHTTNNNGEDSYLYQVNRMIPEDLQVFADENKPQDDDFKHSVNFIWSVVLCVFSTGFARGKQLLR